MLNFRYLDEDEIYNVEVIGTSKNLCSIKGNMPAKNKGFTLSRPNKNDAWDYSKYNTVYKNKDGIITFSSNGSIFIPIVKFNAINGQLDGKLLQNVSNYKDIVIPSPINTSYSKFVKWIPEIPSIGKIEDDIVSFTAEFEIIETSEQIDTGVSLESRVEQLESDVDYLAMCTDVELGG